MNIKVLGPGCSSCQRLEQITRQALREMGEEATLTKVTNMNDIRAYKIVATPGLVINEKVVSAGRIPSASEVVSMIATALSEADA